MFVQGKEAVTQTVQSFKTQISRIEDSLHHVSQTIDGIEYQTKRMADSLERIAGNMRRED